MVVRCCNPSTLEVEVGEPREFKAGLRGQRTGKEQWLPFQRTRFPMPAPTWWLITNSNSGSEGSGTLLYSWALHACDTQAYMQTKHTYT